MSRITNDAGIVVTIVKGTIESQKVNAIVNSTRRDCILNRGEISNSVLASAGSSIQDECKRNTSALENGKVIKIDGYNLPSRIVYHGAVMEWDGAKGKSRQILRSFIKNCHQQANTDGPRSIAFPAIGAGALKIPGEVVVKSLLEEVETFSRQHPETSLKDIRFVVFAQNQHVAAAFKSKLDSLRSPGSSCWTKFVRQSLKHLMKVHMIRRIEELQSIHSFDITLEPSPPPSNHILIIKGTPKDVASVGRIVRQIISNNL